jgi:hypothetical protein
MKKIVIVSVPMLLATAFTFAQQVNMELSNKESREEKREIQREERKTAVSSETKRNFAIDFPNAKNVSFSRSKHFDEVSFTSGGNELQGYYDVNGMLVGTTQDKQFTDLPLAGQKGIRKHFGDYTVEKVILFDDYENNDTDMILYGTSFEDADNYFAELKKADKRIVVKIDKYGTVSYFTEMK